MEPSNSFLDGLNPAQLKAATHPPNSTLQILAGPGSGKTRVLTSRIAHLIINCHLPPFSICAVTFTNKAANEMRERLTKLIGKTRVSQLKMGTFHSLCARFLRKYGSLVNLPDNFTVCDAAESKKIVTTILKEYDKEIKDRGFTLEPGTVLSLISKAKARCQDPEEYLEGVKLKLHVKDTLGNGKVISVEIIVGEVYKEYQAVLRKNNALDFDDLLVYGVELFTRNPNTVDWCRHILVDEFQDTNITQYDLMRAVANSAHCITIVGDPDQSIYGWRAAEVENLAKMRTDFPETTQIFLEESYRSTGAILEASLAIVSQDSKRIAKSLHTSHPSGISPVLYQVTKEQEEASFIAIEIKRLVAAMGGVFSYGDFAILLRYNALSRNLENALQREGIPCRILGGHKFFERLEVKDILAYLQLLDNAAFTPAFLRIVNVPSRSIGEKTLSDVLHRADKAAKSPLELLEGIHDMRIPDSKPSIRKKISSFVTAMRTLRKSAESGMGPSDLIEQVLRVTQYEDHLRRTQPDWETRLENVKELITFAKEVEEQNARDAEMRADPNAELDTSLDVELSPLRQFLQVSMLSSGGDNETEESNQEKVTITTCHSAKGLEWPVVMIPSVDASTYPFIRSEDEDEERRLLYVACTRAKCLLYLTRSTTRMVAGDQKTRGLSKFVETIMEKRASENKLPLFNQRIPQLEAEDRADICKVLERDEPDEEEVERMVEGFVKLGRRHPPPILWGSSTPPSFAAQSSWSRPSTSSSPILDPHAPVTTTPFPLPTFGRPVVPQSFQTGSTSIGRASFTTPPLRANAFPGSLPPVTSVPTPSHSTSGTEPKRTCPQQALSNSNFRPPLSQAKLSFTTNPSNSNSGTVSGTAKPQTRPFPTQNVVDPPKALARPPVLRQGGNASTIASTSGQPSRILPVKNANAPVARTPAPQASGISTTTVQPNLDIAPQGVKRRLGMVPRMAGGGYSNKKFKPPTL